MIVKEIDDLEEVEKILFNPEIYERIRASDEDKLPIQGARYIAGYDNGEIFAIMLYIKRQVTTCHIQVLQTHRAAHAVKFAKKALELREDNILYTNIPDKYPDVIRFAQHFGFNHVDKNIFRGEFG